MRRGVGRDGHTEGAEGGGVGLAPAPGFFFSFLCFSLPIRPALRSVRPPKSAPHAHRLSSLIARTMTPQLPQGGQGGLADQEGDQAGADQGRRGQKSRTKSATHMAASGRDVAGGGGGRAPGKAPNLRAGWQTKGWWRLVGGVDRVGEGDGRGGRGRVRLAPAGRLGAGRDPRSGPDPPVHPLSLSFRFFFTLSFGRRGPRPTPARSPAPTMSGPSPARLLPSAAPAYAPGRLALKKER